MRKITTIIPLLLLFHHIAFSQAWSTKADINTAREGALSFSLNGKIYLGGGNDQAGQFALSDFHEYDPTTDKWITKNNLPQARAYGVAFSINGKGYIGLGKSNGTGSTAYLANIYEYDPSTDKWTQKADIPTGFGMIRSVAFVVNNKAYILGGTNANFASYGTLYEYDPATDKWTQKAAYPITNQGNNWNELPYAFSIGNKGYVSCGEIRKASGLGGEYTNKTFEYDPVNDTWTPKADYPSQGNQGGSAFVLNNKAYCVSGTYKNAAFQDVFHKDTYIYDPSTDNWTKSIDLPGAGRVLSAATVANNKAYLGGGSTWQSGFKKDWYEFTVPVSVTRQNLTSKQATIYPNPVIDKISIDGIERGAKYSIINTLGKLIKRGVISDKAINVHKLPSGNYFITIESNKRATTIAFIKE